MAGSGGLLAATVMGSGNGNGGGAPANVNSVEKTYSDAKEIDNALQHVLATKTQSGPLNFTKAISSDFINGVLHEFIQTDGSAIQVDSVDITGDIASTNFYVFNNDYSTLVPGKYLAMYALLGDGKIGVTINYTGIVTDEIIINSGELYPYNDYAIITLNRAGYGANDGTTPINSSDFKISNFVASGATALSISSVEKFGGGALTGGETVIKVNLNITGTPDGSETFEIQPTDGSSIYDDEGSPMAASQTTGTLKLYDVLFGDIFSGTTIDLTTNWNITSPDNIFAQSEKLSINLNTITAQNDIESKLTYAASGVKVLKFHCKVDNTIGGSAFVGLLSDDQSTDAIRLFAVSSSHTVNGRISLNIRLNNTGYNQTDLTINGDILAGVDFKIVVDYSVPNIKFYEYFEGAWVQIGTTNTNTPAFEAVRVSMLTTAASTNGMEVDDLFLTDYDYSTLNP
jgi:hypothetical protein